MKLPAFNPGHKCMKPPRGAPSPRPSQVTPPPPPQHFVAGTHMNPGWREADLNIVILIPFNQPCVFSSIVTECSLLRIQAKEQFNIYR